MVEKKKNCKMKIQNSEEKKKILDINSELWVGAHKM